MKLLILFSILFLHNIFWFASGVVFGLILLAFARHAHNSRSRVRRAPDYGLQGVRERFYSVKR